MITRSLQLFITELPVVREQSIGKPPPGRRSATVRAAESTPDLLALLMRPSLPNAPWYLMNPPGRVQSAVSFGVLPAGMTVSLVAPSVRTRRFGRILPVPFLAVFFMDIRLVILLAVWVPVRLSPHGGGAVPQTIWTPHSRNVIGKRCPRGRKAPLPFRFQPD